MAFKENLLEKIKIDRLVREIAGAIGPVESGKRIDKAKLSQLMAYFPWVRKQERDLELYLENDESGKTRILVLDNDLTIYNTTVADVVLRKSPTVKEMISIRNAIKILNDADVVVSKKEASLQTVHEVCIGELELDYTEADIDGIAREGIASLENGYAPGVQECLLLFAELLELVEAPKAFSLNHHDIYGKLERKPGGEIAFGPLVIFSLVHGSLHSLDAVLSSRDKSRIERLKAVASGETEATLSGASVFERMKEKVLTAS